MRGEGQSYVSTANSVVPLHVIDVNLGNAVWNKDTCKGTIQTAGIYYLHLTVATCSSVSATNSLAWDVKVNNATAFSVRSQPIELINAAQTRSGASVVHLNKGDVISILAVEVSCFQGSQTAFFGLLVAPD